MPHLKTLQRPPVARPPAPVVDEGLDWGASGWAGLTAGAAFILLQTFSVIVFGGGGGTEALRRLASIVLGRAVLDPNLPFTAVVFLAAALVHIQLSMIYARILAAMIHRRTVGRAVAIGALFGAGLYLLNYYVFSALFPWFVSARGPSALISHLAFGTIAAGLYKYLTLKPAGPT